MNQQQLFELYEKLYFHEVEAREKVSARLQIPLAILLSITSVYAYLSKEFLLEYVSQWTVYFLISIIISLALHITSTSYFVRSFYGYTYEFIPTASETEKYRNILVETYKDFDEKEELVSKYFNEYLYKYYNECSSINTGVNDKRSKLLHRCNTYSILNTIPLTIAFLIFTFAGLDKNSIDKEYKVNIISPINIDTKDIPLNINGEYKVDFTREIKDILHDRQTKTSPTPATASAPKENNTRGRENPSQAKASEINKNKTKENK